MSYCLNPGCSSPENGDRVDVCAACQHPLRLADRYLPIGLIGRGGFGQTFLAIDERSADRSACAIKQLARPYADDRKARSLFKSEAEHLAALGDHGQIPHLIDQLEANGTIYLVQEWIDGPTIAREVLGGPFSPRKVEAFLRDVLPVLQFVHDRGIIHRDIKPSNLIRRRSDRQIVLIDFGIAKVLDRYLLEKTGTIVGSPEYIAPEQLTGKALPASDLYSLAVTCIRLLTGVMPFLLHDSAQDRWVWRDFLPPRTVMPPRLAAVLDRALVRATRDRYGSAAAMVQALDPTQVLPLAPTHVGPPPQSSQSIQSAQTGKPTQPATPASDTHPFVPFFPGRWPSDDLPTVTSLHPLNQSHRDRSTQNTPPKPGLVTTVRPLTLPRGVWWARLLPARWAKTPLCDRGIIVSVVGLNYTALERLLAAGQWQAADELTRELLCEQLSGPRRFIQVAEIPRLSRPDLQAIDHLWFSYSGGRFGFGVQSRIVSQTADYNQFCSLVGWSPSRLTTRDEAFQFQAKAAIGHLPSRNWVGGIQWWRHAQVMAAYLIP